MFVGFDCEMKQLKRSRHIIAYLPDDYYDSQKYYPVLYIQDGQNAFFDELSFSKVSWGFVDYVKSVGLDIIMVAIPCNQEEFKRDDEYGPWPVSKELTLRETGQTKHIIGGEGQLYGEWIVNDLKPYIDEHFRVNGDNAMVGSSSGGVITSYMAFKYPTIFRKTASLSSAYWFYYDEFKELIEKSDLSAIEKFYFDLGEFEGCGDEEITQWYFDSNDFVYSLIKDKIKDIQYLYFEGASHNESEWRQRVPLFMYYFYGDYEDV